MPSKFDKIQKFDALQQKLELKKLKVMEDIMSGDNPTDIMKASQFLQRNDKGNRKSYIEDPFLFADQFGYKDKPMAMTYRLLRNMSTAPIINSIIRTRISQIGNFTEPQRDKYSTGYIIRKKRLPGMTDDDVNRLSLQEEKEIYEIKEFINNCGVNKGWDSGNFDQFIRAIARDSLTFDQYTFEIIHDNKGRPHSFFAVDASTIRLATSLDDDWYEEHLLGQGGRYQKEDKERGFYPSYVQIFDSRIVAEYYPWELCFGIRNPTTSFHANGYGLSELEEMVHVVTSMLWSEEYNRNFFKNGSMPKGLIRLKGSYSNSSLAEFRQYWYATMKGVNNAWKTPIIEGEEFEHVDLQKSNKDMEFNSWLEYLIKVSCALFAIDPAEINFPLQGSSGSSPMFDQSNEYKLKNSKDRGLYPILRHIQGKINKYLISQINEKYEFVFAGLDAITRDKEIEQDEKLVKFAMTINEIRAKYDLDPVEWGDTILDPTIVAMTMQNQMMGDEEIAGEGVEEQEIGDGSGISDGDEYDIEDHPEGDEEFDVYNDVEKSWKDWLGKAKQDSDLIKQET